MWSLIIRSLLIYHKPFTSYYLLAQISSFHQSTFPYTSSSLGLTFDLSFLEYIFPHEFQQFPILGSREGTDGGRRGSSSAFSGKNCRNFPDANIVPATSRIASGLESTKPCDAAGSKPLHCAIFSLYRRSLASTALATTSPKGFWWIRPSEVLRQLTIYFAK